MAASAAASVVWLTPEPSVTLVSDLFSDLGAALALPAFAATLDSFAGLFAAWDSDFLFVTEAFGCTVTGLAAAVFDDDDLSNGLAAALEVVLTAGLAVAFGSGYETALGVVLFVDFTLEVPALALAVAVWLADVALFTAFFAVASGLAALLAEAGFALFAEDVGVLAGFFIAFAMESATKRECGNCFHAAHSRPSHPCNAVICLHDSYRNLVAHVR